jgi:hypothetical protein
MANFTYDIWPQLAAEFDGPPGEMPTQTTRNGLDFGDVALIAETLKKTPLERLLDVEAYLRDIEILKNAHRI